MFSCIRVFVYIIIWIFSKLISNTGKWFKFLEIVIKNFPKLTNFPFGKIEDHLLSYGQYLNSLGAYFGLSLRRWVPWLNPLIGPTLFVRAQSNALNYLNIFFILYYPRHTHFVRAMIFFWFSVIIFHLSQFEMFLSSIHLNHMHRYFYFGHKKYIH